MARNTIKVEQVKEMVNTMLAAPDTFTIDGIDPHSQRMGACGLLEQVLHATGNYKGFTHLDSEWDAVNWQLREGYDDSRRRYL